MKTLRIRVSEDDKEWLLEQAGDGSISSVVQDLIEAARSGRAEAADEPTSARTDRLSDRVDALEARQSAGEHRTREAAAVDATDARLDVVSAIVEAAVGTLDISSAALDRVREIVRYAAHPDDAPADWDADALTQEARLSGLDRVVCLAVVYDALRDRGRITTGALEDECYARAPAGFSTGRWRKFTKYLGALPEVDAPGNGQQEWHFHADRVPEEGGAAERES